MLFKSFVILVCALLLVSMAGIDTRPDALAEEAPDVTVSSVTAGNVTMEYAVFGSGEKDFIILPGLSLHGVMGSASAIADAYRDFAGDYTVYVLDGPKEVPEGYTVRELARDTASVMEALGIGAADLFGASLGGMTALYLAIDAPEKVGSMIIGSACARPNETFRAVGEEWVGSAEDRNETALLESFADRVYSEATLAAWRDYLIESNRGVTDAEYRRFITLAQSCMTYDCYDELSSVHCPVLVIGSEGDRIVTAEGSREIAEALGCGLILYDESYGHGVYDEAPDYRENCLNFLLGDH